ncbi:MAG: hypothetical protein IT454_12125 [Planctomycetes bacterium]|nr:hypothetical protein [Planctomycetota bacterium]
MTDPKGLVTRNEYDAAGRRTKVIANYVDGTPGGGTNGDEDQVVSYAYIDGLQVSITADLPSGETDQVTTSTFGTTKGTGPSRVGRVRRPVGSVRREKDAVAGADELRARAMMELAQTAQLRDTRRSSPPATLCAPRAANHER